MDKRVAEVVAGSSSYNADIREDYSGRGMYGKTTAAIVMEEPAGLVHAFVVAALEAEREGDGDLADDIAKAAKRLRTDQLGRSVVVY
jgi:hypothetical protein